MMSGGLGVGYIGSYTSLQAYLRANYYHDLADMKTAIEKTVGTDPAKRAQLGSKLKLLVTALHILEHNVTEASQEEYNALVHLGERVKSSVDLYRAQKASRAASRAAAAVGTGPPAPQVQVQRQPPQPPAEDALWEMPLEHISLIIADERKRLLPVPELAALQQPTSPAAAAQAPDAQRVNPFMQQALAIAQGLPFAGPSPDGSVSLPPLRAQTSAPMTGQRGVALLDLGGLSRINRSWADPGSGRAGVALAYSSGFYSMGATPTGGARTALKRPAAALAESGVGGASTSGKGAAAGQGVGGAATGRPENGRTKYRSVSFDQPMRLRTLNSCPEAEFSFWGAAEGALLDCRHSSSQDPTRSGSATPTATCAAPAPTAPDNSVSPFVQLAARQQVGGTRTFFSGVPQSPAGAATAAAAQQQGSLSLGPKQASAVGQGLGHPLVGVGQPSLGLSTGLAQQSGGMNLSQPSAGMGLTQTSAGAVPLFSSQQLSLGILTGRSSLDSGGGSQQLAPEALLHQRQRQWQQLLALRLQQQQATAPDGMGQPQATLQQLSQQLPLPPFAMASGGPWPEQPRLAAEEVLIARPSDLSPAQMILQGLPPEAESAEPAGPGPGNGAAGGGMGGLPLCSGGTGSVGARVSTGAPLPLEPSKHDSAPSQSPPASLSTSGSGVSRGSNGALAVAACSGDVSMLQACDCSSGAVGAGQAERDLPQALARELSDGASLSLATARLQLNALEQQLNAPGEQQQQQQMPWEAGAAGVEEGTGAAAHAMSEQEKQGWEQLLMQAGAGNAAAQKVQTPLPPPGLFQQQLLLKGQAQGRATLQLMGGMAASAAGGPAMGAAAATSFFDFVGGQPLDMGQQGQQPSAACEALRTSGLIPLTSSTFDALAVQLQPSQQHAAAGMADTTAPLQQQRSSFDSAQQQQHEQHKQHAAAAAAAFDAGSGSGGGVPQLELGDGGGLPPLPPGAIPLVPSLPSMFAMAGAQAGRANSEPSSEAAAMMQAPSLQLNPLDVTRLDSLLFDLGPDFLPDFDGSAGL